jgi:DNA-binding CsgD family transcriptional regulator
MVKPMPRGSPRTEQVVREFGRGLPAAPSALDVLRGAADTLLAAVPADIWCGVLLDPSTLLDTGGVHVNSFPQAVMPRVFEIEHLDHVGADNLRSLAGRPDPVSLLSRSAGDRLDGDVYYREILRPLGMADELRVVLRDGRQTWGLLVWCRGGSGFADEDVATAEALVAPAATALRGSLAVAGADDRELPDAPGLVIVSRSGEVESVSPTAQRWLDELQDEHRDDRPVPNAVRALAAAARAASLDRPGRSRAPTRSGRWLSMHAWALDADRVVVTIGPAGLNELIAIVLDVYNLTPRERQVTQHILHGASTREVARALSLSPYTVQDHLRSIFAKVGVGSARELMSAVFGRHYLPQLGSGLAPHLTTDGRLFDVAAG